MKCNYCKLEKSLCKAHLIPESFFRFMYPNGKVEGDSLIMLEGKKNYLSHKRVGFWDNNILCAECDAILGKFDKYGKEIFLDSEPELLKEIGDGKGFFFNDIDIPKIKLFILSVVWRCSITNIPEFKQSKLPFKFENALREMIINNNPGGINDFSIVITRFGYDKSRQELRKFIQTPVRNRINGINYLNLYLANGYKIIIKTDNRNQERDLLPISIDINRPVYVLQHHHFEKSPEYKALLHNAQKIKK